MPPWIPLKLIPGLVIFACAALALHALVHSEWRGALLLLGFLAVLTVLTFGLVRYPAADCVVDHGDHLHIVARSWTGALPLVDIDAVSFRPALNGRVVTLHLKAGVQPAAAWVFVPRLVMRAGMPGEVDNLQQRVQRLNVATNPGRADSTSGDR